jgi:hypothetical protein
MAYSEKFKARALIKLAENRNDYDITAGELGCSSASLRLWSSGNNLKKSKQKKENFKNDGFTVADYLEQAVIHMLSNPPQEMKGSAWATTVGVLMDKWLILQDKPTSRTETLTRMLESMPDEQRSELIKDAERVVSDYSRATTGGGE